MDDVGCTTCTTDTAETDATSYLEVITNDKQVCTECSVMFLDCTLCTDTECTSCESKLLDTGVCTDSCDDANCRTCNADKSTCEHCANGYVLTGGSCVQQTCTVGNCDDCTSNAAECDTCMETYFLSSSTVCTTCIGNCIS
jgi:hypothetical protein